MDKTSKLTVIKEPLAHHYFEIVNQAINVDKFDLIDIDWLQIQSILSYGQVRFTAFVAKLSCVLLRGGRFCFFDLLKLFRADSFVRFKCF